jgi:hypothetical protein
MGDDDDGPKYELYPQGQDVPRAEMSKMFSGFGKAFYPNGDTYDGVFIEGYRRGKGIYTFKKNGDKYDGFYEENKKHGFGKMAYTSKTGEEEEEAAEDEKPSMRAGTYLGYFNAGLRGGKAGAEEKESEGTFTYANGDIYVGQWQSGKKHGRGSYSYAKDGTKLVGDWVQGKITNGEWIFPNGTFYSGKFRYNKPFGKGVWVFKNGNQLTGEYIQKEEQTEEDPPADGDEDVVKPDPKVSCRFQHGKNVAVQGGAIEIPK